MLFDTVLSGDCLELLPDLPGESVDLFFTDPPFNIGYEYDTYNDRRGRADYLAWTTRWLREVRRVLKPTASVWIAIGDEYAAEMKIRLDELGLTRRSWVIWHYTFGVNCTKKFNRSHVHLFHYVVDPKRFTFNAEAVRVPSARQTTYADRRANPVGKLPDDTWVLRPQEDERFFRPEDDTWHEPRVCGTFRERRKRDESDPTTAHPCQMPEAILARIIRVSSNPGDLVLDIFGGSGTTPAVAKKLERRYLTIELSQTYAEVIRTRLAAIEAPRTSAARVTVTNR